MTVMFSVVELARARQLGRSGQGRRAREAAGLSVRELAAAVGVEAGTLSRWETGRCRPRADAALRWLTTLDSLASETSEVDSCAR
jgi:transcriptional regulator with XRE-family HTH domain